MEKYDLNSISKKELFNIINFKDDFIKDSGIYEVKINFVRFLTNSTGAKSFSINCSLINKIKQSLIYGSIFENYDGTMNEIGVRQLKSLQIVCGIRNLIEGEISIKKFNSNEKIDINSFYGFENKKIKIQVLKEYSKYNGEIKTRLLLKNCFRLEDNASADEILSEKDYGSKMKFLESNKDYILKQLYKGVEKEEVESWLKSKKEKSK